MKDKIGTIGHVDHGKTALAAAYAVALSKTKKETQTIHEIIEEQETIKITAPYEIPLIEWNHKSGKEGRRERRAKERKSKKNNSK